MMDGRRIRREAAAGEGMTGENLNQRLIHCTVYVYVCVVGFMASACVQIWGC